MKTLTRSLAFAGICAILSLTAVAADLEVKAPWVRSTVQSQPATGAFMELSSKSGATVVGAASPVASSVEVHEMKLDNGVMKMRAVRELEVPAGGNVSLAPGGYHVMMMGLKQQLKPGSTVPLSLKLKGKDGKTQTVEIKAEVRDMTAGHEAMHGAMHQHMHDSSK